MSSDSRVIALGLLNHFFDRRCPGDIRSVPSLHSEYVPGRITVKQKETGVIVWPTDRQAGNAAQTLAINVGIQPSGKGS
jgi:hypothetical protein